MVIVKNKRLQVERIESVRFMINLVSYMYAWKHFFGQIPGLSCSKSVEHNAINHFFFYELWIIFLAW